MAAYYNEIDPYAAAWLRNLIDAGHIAPGFVDERSIEDVHPSDIRGFTQCHFFAGIGVWSLALRRAGWPDDRPVWTGSCPCQPFSSAGKGAGFADERHLWPAFFHLIGECRPPVVYGEQVASSDVGPWLDLVQADVEDLGYAFGCVAFPSAGVGAPHIRDRLFWLANANSGARREGRADLRGRADRGNAEPRPGLGGGGVSGRLGNAERIGPGRDAGAGPGQEGGAGVRAVGDDAGPSGAACRMGNDQRAGLALCERLARIPSGASGADAGQATERTGIHAAVGMGDTQGSGWRGRPGQLGGLRPEERLQAGQDGAAGPVNGLWRAADWLACTDGKWRPVEPGSFPLAHGAPARVGRLRAYGNAINAEAARVFIEATL